jgi:DNA-binding XRE family transcriptional regulator
MPSSQRPKTEISRHKRGVPTKVPTVPPLDDQLTTEEVGKLFARELMASAKAEEELPVRLDPVVVAWGKEIAAKERRRQQAYWDGLSLEERERIRETWRKRRGRPKGSYNSPCNGDLLRECRKECRGARSQERFAEECGVSVATIRRGEKDWRFKDSVLIKFAATIRRLSGRNITADDLKK